MIGLDQIDAWRGRGFSSHHNNPQIHLSCWGAEEGPGRFVVKIRGRDRGRDATLKGCFFGSNGHGLCRFFFDEPNKSRVKPAFEFLQEPMLLFFG